MGSLYVKGSKLWARYKDERGKWKGAPTPYRPGDETKARRFLKSLEAESEAKRKFVEEGETDRNGPITVAAYVERWVTDRKQLGLVSASDDNARLKLHALKFVGEMPLEDVRPRHLRDMVLAMRKDAVLAPRTIRKV